MKDAGIFCREGFRVRGGSEKYSEDRVCGTKCARSWANDDQNWEKKMERLPFECYLLCTVFETLRKFIELS